ncbi:protein farnesyltransferase subunit [Musa troglodytarum]|uniref:Protein farnesyltransferase subunit beta n=1 Tax=Musa troglodytarum TaxID=320322 RepID=A0A9E7KYS3_9LILI|nr:protein farnesyltransferase subunit [Musa troglodytarum]
MRSSSFYASYQTQHQAKGKAKARLMPLRIAHRRSAAPKTKDRRTRATTTRREARREAAAGRCSSSGLPRSGSSTPMESSPTRSSSSSLSLPPSPSDRQGRLTTTQLEQLRVEQEVYGIYRLFHGVAPHTRSFMVELWRDKHIEFLARGLKQLGPSYHVLDANRPWLCYWIIHSITLMGESVNSELEDNVVQFLSHCEDKNGGYGGGPGQMPHLATTYAAVNTLITLGSEMSLSSIHRENMLKFLLQMKDSSGAFRMHNGGEIDVRACYTAISVASILNVLDDELVTDLGNYILSCQTYEGGIAGEPGSEAHGGYTFCGLATMILINEVDKLDLPSLVGGVLALAQRLLPIVHKQLESSFISGVQASAECKKSCNFTAGETGQDENLCRAGTSHPDNEGEKLSDFGFSSIGRQTECGPLFHSIALQQYILLCSQVLEGGFRDKPGKQRDFYHSCYCLSGLSVSQYSWSKDDGEPPLTSAVLGPYTNLLEPVHPLYNVISILVPGAVEFFFSKSKYEMVNILRVIAFHSKRKPQAQRKSTQLSLHLITGIYRARKISSNSLLFPLEPRFKVKPMSSPERSPPPPPHNTPERPESPEPAVTALAMAGRLSQDELAVMVSVVDGGEDARAAGYGRVSTKADNGLGAVPWSLRRRAVMRAALGLRVSAALLCLVSFSVMVADNTEGWAGDSFGRYSEYRYEPMFSFHSKASS